MELLPTIDALHWIASAGPGILADDQISLPIFLKQKQARLAYEPLGVVGVIAPWNYPWSIPFGEVAIALMCGNGVVLKPASLTPLIGQRIQRVFERAGLPEGIVRTVHGGGAVGRRWWSRAPPRSSSPGSVEVGRGRGRGLRRADEGLRARAGRQGPHAGAGRRQPASNAVSGACGAASPTRARPARVSSACTWPATWPSASPRGSWRAPQALRVGDPMDRNTEIGPMVSREQFDLVARAGGRRGGRRRRRCAVGGRSSPAAPQADWFAPAVLTGVTHEMRIMREEIFGPVLCVMTVDSEDEAIALANDSDFGLGASVWTTDRPRGERIARRSSPGWSGSTTTCTPTARAPAPGAA